MEKKIALITGASRGLGRAAALALAADNVHLILTYQSRAADAQAVVEQVERLGVKAVALKLDVADVKSFAAFSETVRQELRERWQTEHFDYLINNAGFGGQIPFAQLTEDQFDALVNVHFKGVFFLTQKLLPLLANGGRILNVSSGLTRFAFPGYSAYASMKGAVEVLSRYLAKELGERRIAVNTIAPGAIETDFGGGAARDNAEYNRLIAERTALGRVGLPEDIGDAIAALLSDRTRWMNGQRVEFSGGMLL